VRQRARSLRPASVCHEPARHSNCHRHERQKGRDDQGHDESNHGHANVLDAGGALRSWKNLQLIFVPGFNKVVSWKILLGLNSPSPGSTSLSFFLSMVKIALDWIVISSLS
jgi:hypothetical protein